jgi:hypothetical protein
MQFKCPGRRALARALFSRDNGEMLFLGLRAHDGLTVPFKRVQPDVHVDVFRRVDSRGVPVWWAYSLDGRALIEGGDLPIVVGGDPARLIDPFEIEGMKPMPNTMQRVNVQEASPPAEAMPPGAR